MLARPRVVPVPEFVLLSLGVMGFGIARVGAQQETEACCLPGGQCEDMLPCECFQAGGVSRGANTSCATIQCTEACCLPDGTCDDLVPEICLYSALGTPMGPYTVCGSSTCPQPPKVACCIGASCLELSEGECLARGGSPRGSISCAEVQCLEEPWACCLQTGECRDYLRPADCQSIGGTPIESATCTMGPCPPPTEACCFLDWTCLQLTLDDCNLQGGIAQGAGSTCETALCTPQACCFPDGSCLDTVPSLCEALGGWPQGRTRLCAEAACVPWLACCLPEDGGCVDLPPSACIEMYDGVPLGPELHCSEVDCADKPVVGACCNADGSCRDLPGWLCLREGGLPLNDGTGCESAECGLQACCADGLPCRDLPPIHCEWEGGMPMGSDTLCAESDCSIQACCLPGGDCQELSSEACVALGGAGLGLGSRCGEATCTPTQVHILQRAKGVFLAEVPFHNAFKAVVDHWGGGEPGTVSFLMAGRVPVVLPYIQGGVETSEFDMGDLDSGDCVTTSVMKIVATNAAGFEVGSTSLRLQSIRCPWLMPPPAYIRVGKLSPLLWNQEIVYEACATVLPFPPCLAELHYLDAVWRGKNALFQNYGGLFSGGELQIEFNGAKAEAFAKVKLDVGMEPAPRLGALWKPVTHKRKISIKGERTLGVELEGRVAIDQSTGCFTASPAVCGGADLLAYEWRLVPIGPLFGFPGLWFTGKAELQITPELCLDLALFSLSNPLPVSSVDIRLNLTGQGGLEMGIPYFLSLFGGLEGNASGRIHVLGEPVATCWGLPYLADLAFDLGIVGYARCGFHEWLLGRYVIVAWNCPLGPLVASDAASGSPIEVIVRPAGRPYASNGEPYARFAAARSIDLQAAPSSGADADSDTLVTANVNLDAAPGLCAQPGEVLLVTTEDDLATPDHVETEVYVARRSGGIWGEKKRITDNDVPDLLAAAGFDASGRAIVAWTTIPGASVQDDFRQMKSRMEIAWSAYDPGSSTWSPPAQLTWDGASLDGLPQIVRGGDGSTTVVWLHSADNTLPIAPGEPAGSPVTVMTARWNGTSFDEPSTLLGSCEAVGQVRYNRDAAGREYLVWTVDSDHDLATTEDREVMVLRSAGGGGAGPVPLTSNVVADTAAAVVSLPPGVVAYYLRAGSAGPDRDEPDTMWARVFDGWSWSSEALQLSSPGLLSVSLTKSSTGGVTCVWVGPSDRPSGTTMFYATSPTGVGGWSRPQELIAGGRPSVPSCAYAGQTLEVAYVSARLPAFGAAGGQDLFEPMSALFDVRLLDHVSSTDLRLGPADVTVEPQPPVAGRSAVVHVTVHLSGDHSVGGVLVRLWDMMPDGGDALIGALRADVIAGGQATLDFPWVYPSRLETHTLAAWIDPENTVLESDELNNVASVPLGVRNVEAVALYGSPAASDAIELEICLRNSGALDLENVEYEVRKESEAGPVILQGMMPRIAAGRSVRQRSFWNVASIPSGTYPLFLMADPRGLVREEKEDDNIVSRVVGVLPDLEVQQWSVRGRPGLIRVTIRNIGTKPCLPGTVKAAVQQVVGEVGIPAIAPGASHTAVIPVAGAVPGETVTVTVASGSVELSSLNNVGMVVLKGEAMLDFDLDGDVDLQDYLFLQSCGTGPAVSLSASECRVADLDQDDDIDSIDFAILQRCFGAGPGSLPSACAQ